MTCAVEPPLPAGITLDRKAPCKLSGRPSAFQRATRYRFQATDRDGDEAALAFRVAVEAPVDDARFVSYAGVPERMAPGSTATVTVRMRNTGRTTWRAKSWFALGSQSPEDNKTWGLRRVPLRRDVPPNAEVDFTFKIAAPAKAGSHGFRWRMVREAPWWVGEGWFGLRTEHRTIRVEADTSPSFDRPSKLDLRLAIDEPMGAVTLPPASGGNGKLSYRILEELPDGLNFDGATRTLSGAPDDEAGGEEVHVPGRGRGRRRCETRVLDRSPGQHEGRRILRVVRGRAEEDGAGLAGEGCGAHEEHGNDDVVDEVPQTRFASSGRQQELGSEGGAAACGRASGCGGEDRVRHQGAFEREGVPLADACRELVRGNDGVPQDPGRRPVLRRRGDRRPDVDEGSCPSTCCPFPRRQVRAARSLTRCLLIRRPGSRSRSPGGRCRGRRRQPRRP